MGGFSGEVRGKSKIETYLNYVKAIEHCGGTFNSHYPDGKKKKLCKSLMEQDSESGDWILRCHFHT
jgi:hypothetical protein